jgi:DNA-binding GntR family transcriptional regulator
MVSAPRRTKPLLGNAVPSLHDRIVAELRRAIVTRRFAPGERLVEERLAEEMGVSRVPVREAIRALASEGFVELTARRGASVAKLSLREARETIELRALLEGQNARLAARKCDPGVHRRITAVLTKGTAAVEDNRFDQLAELNNRFHEELARAGQNTVLADTLQRLRVRTEMLFAPALPDRQRVSWEEHAAILRAIIDGDEERAAECAAAHVVLSGEAFLREHDVPEPAVEPARRARAVKSPKAA